RRTATNALRSLDQDLDTPPLSARPTSRRTNLAKVVAVCAVLVTVSAAAYWQRGHLAGFLRENHIGSAILDALRAVNLDKVLAEHVETEHAAEPKTPPDQAGSSSGPRTVKTITIIKDSDTEPAPITNGSPVPALPAPGAAARVVLYEEDPSDPQ